MTELRDITNVHGKCTYLYNESLCNEIWPLTMHFNKNKSSSKCTIQPMSSILWSLGYYITVILLDKTTTMSQYRHFPVIKF